MKKLYVIIMIIISSVFSFSASAKKSTNKTKTTKKVEVVKPVQKKKLDVELKAMLSGGYDHVAYQKFVISAEVGAYKKFEVKKINTIFNVGGGLDFTNYFDSSEYEAIIRPYFSTEIAGYVSPDVRMFTDIKLGIGISANKHTVIAYPKTGITLGMTYKERFTVELGYNIPTAITLGFGARFGF